MITRFWDFVDSRGIVRRVVLYITLWMTWEAFAWAKGYSALTTLSGSDSALVIAAVTAPVAALQAFTFKWYMESRS